MTNQTQTEKNELRTEIILNAPAEKIWEVLTNLSAYSAWNPFIVKASGKIIEGERLNNTLMNNGKPMTFKPQVTAVAENKRFEWLGTALMGGFKGRHYFELEDAGKSRTKLIHGEHFSGFLSGLIFPLLRKNTLSGFMAMNRALQSRLESLEAHESGKS